MKYNRVLVALDQSDKDPCIISATRYLSELIPMGTIEFIHVLPELYQLGLREGDLREMLQLDASYIEHSRTTLLNMISTNFEGIEDSRIEFSLFKGKVYDELLDHIRSSNPELFIYGKKKPEEGSGSTMRRLMSKAKTDILQVGTRPMSGINSVLVPFDFSPHAETALHRAVSMSHKGRNLQILVLYVLPIPSLGYKLNKNRDSMIAMFKESAVKRFEGFVRSQSLQELGLQFIVEVNDEFEVSRYIQKVVREKDIDAVILGAKGHTALAELFFGSCTEKLMTYECDRTLYVVRKPES